MKNCRNCGKELIGSYCYFCGQKADLKPINFQFVLSEIRNGIMQIDRGFVYTVKELFTRPGHTIREYIEGKRVKHFKPISLVLLLALIYGILVHYLGTSSFLSDFMAGFNERGEESGTDYAQVTTLLSWLINNYQYTSLLFIPLWSLASYLIFLRKPYNYFEHFLLVTFLTAQRTFIDIVFVLLAGFVPITSILNEYAPFIGTIVNIWAYTQFFNKSNKFATALKALLVFTLFSFLLLIIISAIAIIDLSRSS